jgi:hypothetical protein
MSDQLAIFDNSNNGRMLSTISLESAHDKNRALRALNAAESLASAVQADHDVFDVVDIFQVPGSRRSRIEGVPDTPCRNTYFLLADGRALMSQSDGIATSCEMLLALYPDCGRSSEKGCLTLAVHERKLPNGNTIKSVYPVD